MSIPVRYWRGARTTASICAAVERAVADGMAAPNDLLPTVRSLAAELGVSANTVAAAYRRLAERGIVTGEGRRGTRISAGPPVAAPAAAPVPEGAVDLATGTPDPRLLPDLRSVLRRTAAVRTTYAGAGDLDALTAPALDDLQADGVPATRVVVASGALDGVERVLQARLRPGDRVAVEDPGYPRVADVVGALGLRAVPVRLDERGMVPDALADALGSGARAVVSTPRGQNPTGAAVDATRARQLRRVLADHPDVLVIEDDHAAAIAGAPYATTVASGRARWAVVRSVAKTLGPDLRVALVTGDEATLARVEGRLRLGAGWVSHVLQQAVVDLWADPRTTAAVERAAQFYAERRAALLDALAGHGIAAVGATGLNVWVPVRDEDATIAGLLARGWAVAGGERFRLQSPPAVRITVASLSPAGARRVAADLAAVLDPRAGASTFV